jgi:hypothetical protein
MAGFAIEGDMALNTDETDAILFDGAEELRWAIHRAFQLVKGTWIFDRNAGFPLHDYVAVMEHEIALLERAVRATLRTFDRVQEIQSVRIDLDQKTRVATANYVVKLDNSETLTGDVNFPTIG